MFGLGLPEFIVLAIIIVIPILLFRKSRRGQSSSTETVSDAAVSDAAQVEQRVTSASPPVQQRRFVDNSDGTVTGLSVKSLCVRALVVVAIVIAAHLLSVFFFGRVHWLLERCHVIPDIESQAFDRDFHSRDRHACCRRSSHCACAA